jgi:rubredoxin
MSIAFRCEQCGKTFQTDAGNAGKKGKCKQCGHVFVIPAAKSPSEGVAPRNLKTFGAAPTKPAPGSRPEPAVADDPYGLDEAAPLPPRRGIASAVASEVDDLRLPKPPGFKSGKSKRGGGYRSEAFGGLPVAYFFGAFGLAAASFLVSLFGPPTVGAIFKVLAGLAAIVPLLYGGIGMLVIPFGEGPFHGALCFFFWPY